MTNIFEYIDAVSSSKKDLMRGSENDELVERGYSSFMTNRALSYHPDAVFYANEMNQRSHLDNLFQFDYFINSLRKRKRFAKWSKPEASHDLEAIMEYFAYGRVKAESAMLALSAKDIAVIHERLEKGGAKNEQRKADRRSSRNQVEEP